MTTLKPHRAFRAIATLDNQLGLSSISSTRMAVGHTLHQPYSSSPIRWPCLWACWYWRDQCPKFVALTSLHFCLAGVAGFEPANAGIKTRCLTTWRHPITESSRFATASILDSLPAACQRNRIWSIAMSKRNDPTVGVKRIHSKYLRQGPAFNKYRNLRISLQTNNAVGQPLSSYDPIVAIS